MKNWIDSGNDVLLVAEDDNKIVGYVTSQFHAAPGKAVVENLFVSENYRGKGLGSELVDECVRNLEKKGAKYICALVEPDNEAIIKTLENKGFSREKQFLWMAKS